MTEPLIDVPDSSPNNNRATSKHTCKHCQFTTADLEQFSQHLSSAHNKPNSHNGSNQTELVHNDDESELVHNDKESREEACIVDSKGVHIKDKIQDNNLDTMATSPVQTQQVSLLKGINSGEDLTNNNALKSLMPDVSKESIRHNSSSILLNHSIEKQLHDSFEPKSRMNGLISYDNDVRPENGHQEFKRGDKNSEADNINGMGDFVEDDDDDDNIELVIDEDVDTENSRQPTRRHSSSASDDIVSNKSGDISTPSSPYSTGKPSYVNPYTFNADVPVLTSNAIDMMRSVFSNNHRSLVASMASQNPAISQHLNHIVIKPQPMDELSSPAGLSASSISSNNKSKNSDNSSLSSHTPTTTPVKRCAPVREAVDPAKYITVQEGDGIKYACSKCGNIYKWRKSLNKHWKEKHDGEIPEPRSANMNNMTMPRISATSFRPTVGPSRVANNLISQISPRGLPMQASPKDAFNSALARYKSPLLGNPFSPKMGASHFASSTGYSTSTPKQPVLNNQHPSYRPSQSGEAYSPKQNLSETFANSTVLQYLKQRSPLKLAQDDSSVGMKVAGSSSNNSQLSPPAAHSNKPIPQYIPPRPVAINAPIDLTRDLPLALPPSHQSDVGGILDLSRKRTSTPRQPPLFVLPPQDEPLDFSNPIKVARETNRDRDNRADDYGRHPKTSLPSWNSHNMTSSESAYYNSGSGKKENVHSPPVPSQLKQVACLPQARVTTTEPLRCHVCTYATRDQNDMDLHMQLHFTEVQFLCAECQESFSTLELLNQHFAVEHMKCISRHMSEIRSEQNNGEMQQQNTGPQLYRYLTMDPSKTAMACLVCGAMYQWQWALAKHFEQDHASLPNPYQLAANEEDCRNSASPVKTPHTSPFKCNHCPFVTGTKSDLTRHQIRHSLNKHHVCKVCGYTAKSKDELQGHYGEEHPHVDPLELKSLTGTVILNNQEDDSNNSSENFLGADGLLELTGGENTAIVIPQAPEDSNRSKAGRKPKANSPSSVDVLLPYKCTACEYRARWPSEITQHMKNHSDEKPFLCPRCTYRSKWKWDVVKHLKRCGGGTVKDVIDTTRLKKNQLANPLYGVPESIAYTQGRELSNGPPNVTVVPGSSGDSTSSTTTGGYRQQTEGHSVQSTDEDQTSNNSGNPNDPLECSKCSFVACSPAEMRRHLKFHSYEANQVYCNQCPFVGNNPAELKRHLRVHSDEKPFICKTCGYSSKWKCDLKKHCNTYNHLPAVPLTYGGHGRKPTLNTSNHDTSAVYDDDDNGDSYEDGEASDGAHEYSCDLCSFQSTSSSLYKAHLHVHQDDNTTSYKCEQCHYQGKELSAYLDHKQSHFSTDSNNQNNQLDDHEDMSENSDTDLIEGSVGDADLEIKEHGGSSSSRRKQPKQTIMKNLSLDEEDGNISHESQSNESKIDQDQRTPSYSGSGKIYICTYCPYRTHNRANYDRHMPHHQTLSKYQCEWCNWSTDRLNLLYRHAQVIHPGQVSLIDKEVFYDKVKDRCNYLEGSPIPSEMLNAEADEFGLNLTLDGALKYGNGNNVFSDGKKTKRRIKTCGKCGYITDNVTTLQRHMAKHGKLGKYTCTFCDYSVDKQHILDYHIRLVHTKEIHNPNLGYRPEHLDSMDNNSNSSTIDFNDNASIGNSSSISDSNIAEDDGLNLESADISTVQGEDVKIVHVGTRTVYGCTKCPYHTMKISGVLNHSRQHGQEKRFCCTYCDYSVDQSAHVKNHMKTVHGHNVETINPADLLRSNMYDVDDMDSTDIASNGNDSEIHEEDDCEYEPQGKKPRINGKQNIFGCFKCAHIATNKIEWLKHKLVHMDELKTPLIKSHLCDRCPYRTGNKSQLEAHKTRHGVSSKYDCPYCDYSCGNATQQGNHVKLHFPNNEVVDKTTLQLLIKGENINGYMPVTRNEMSSPLPAVGHQEEPLSPLYSSNDIQKDSVIAMECGLKDYNNTDINCNTASIDDASQIL